MEARALVPDGAGCLAIAREAHRGDLVHGHPDTAAGQQGLADTGPTEDRLERPHVLVLTHVGCRHDGQLRPRTTGGHPPLPTR